VSPLLPHAVAQDIDSHIVLDDRASALIARVIVELAHLTDADTSVKSEEACTDPDAQQQ
jgi:hypothetical protein